MKHLIRIRVFLKPYTWQIIANLIILLSMTGLSLVVPRIIQNVIDDGLLKGQSASIIRSAGILLVLGLLSAALGLIQRYLAQWTASHIGYDLRNRLYDHIQYMTFTFHDHSQTGQLISRCIEDVRAIQDFSGSSIIEWIQLVLLGGGIAALMLIENWKLALIALLPIIPLLWVAADFGNRITILFYRVDNALGELSARLQENVSGAQVVRAFAREPYEIDRFDNANRDYFKARITVVSNWATIMPTTSWLVTAGTILILWFGGQMVMRGEMSVGAVVAFNAYLLMLAAPAQQLTWLVNAGGEASAGAQRVWEILDHIPEIQSPAGAMKLPTLTGEVEFKGVWLKYQDEKRDSLADVNVRVKMNQIVALIGATGSGKTSLINLIPRFYDVSGGAVLVDGINVRKVDLVSLRKQIGIVLQTSLLFSDTIRENIRYGRPEASEEEIINVAKAAQAHEFITGFPQGYDTVVGERGVTLSGGQRQRVAIARALLMDPRILILDDSLSSVDTQTEKLIQEALDKLMEGRTTFVIAHRLSTVRRADLILVMDNGRIVQRGRHEELLAQGGLYKEIHDLQLQATEEFVNDMEEMETSNEPVSIEKILPDEGDA
ncbi:MAG TPA: ABC transporter ATP-binding protein [Anaerolineales bacterium]|jgi:ATP-binding cassette subfamily B protein